MFSSFVLRRLLNARRGDIIGCGLSFLRNEAFFTNNGSLVGSLRIPKQLPEYFPTVSMNGPKASIQMNFGETPFRFNLMNHIENEMEISIHEIMLIKEPVESTASLVAGYLYLNGFAETFQSLLSKPEARISGIKLIKEGLFGQEELNSTKIEEEDEAKSTQMTETTDQMTTASPDFVAPLHSYHHSSFIREMISTAFYSLASRTPSQQTQSSGSRRNSAVRSLRPLRHREESFDLHSDGNLHPIEELSWSQETLPKLSPINLNKEKLETLNWDQTPEKHERDLSQRASSPAIASHYFLSF